MAGISHSFSRTGIRNTSPGRCSPVRSDGVQRLGVDAGGDALLGLFGQAQHDGVAVLHRLADGLLPVLAGQDVLVPPDGLAGGEQVVAQLAHLPGVVTAVGQKNVLGGHGGVPRTGSRGTAAIVRQPAAAAAEGGGGHLKTSY